MSHGCWGSAQACRVNFEPKFNPANSKDYHKIVDKLPENLMRKAMEILHEMNEKEDVSLNPWVYKEEGTFEVGICKKKWPMQHKYHRCEIFHLDPQTATQRR